MNDNTSPGAPENEVRVVIDKRPGRWLWPVALVCCVAILAGTSLCWLMVLKAGGIAAKFRRGSIQHTWIEEVTRISRAQGLRLEVGVVESWATIQRSDELNWLWGKLYLGTTATEIRVPATYRYHIQLNDDWRVDTEQNVCLVRAPRIEPTLPVAFDSSRMQKRTDQGWARWDADKQMAELEATLTQELARHAKVNVALVRDQCRKTVAEFVQKWLVREEHWRQDRFVAIKVGFENEGERSFEDADPVLRLE
jgi:hypothetical protein